MVTERARDAWEVLKAGLAMVGPGPEADRLRAELHAAYGEAVRSEGSDWPHLEGLGGDDDDDDDSDWDDDDDDDDDGDMYAIRDEVADLVSGCEDVGLLERIRSMLGG